MRVLFCAGTFDTEEGKPSGWATKVNECLESLLGYSSKDFINGGNINLLTSFIADKKITEEYDVIIWMPNINNIFEKLLPKLSFKNTAILVQSKLNNSRYTKEELINRMSTSGASLLIECNVYNGMVKSSLLNKDGTYLIDTSCILSFSNSLSENIEKLYATC